jgi:hypothetical protein
VLSLADVVDLLAHELARLRAGRFAGSLIRACALDGFFLGHVRSLRDAE